MSSPDASRLYTRRLSELLSSADGALTLAAMQKLRGPAPAADRPRVPRPDGETIGVWRRDGADFVRDEDRRSEWRYWAEIEKLPLDEERRRVVLLGESVARGYYYDPGTNFALLLGDCLQQVSGLDGVDVLDLARTDASSHVLLRSLLEAATLRPEALVVFAGNNWNGLELTSVRRQSLADAMRTGGFPAAQRLFREHVVEHASVVLDTLAAVGEMLGAAVALVIPEFNIADWVDERSIVCPVLRGDGQRIWQQARVRAERALAEGRVEDAAELAGEMARLDEGTSPVSQRLLAAALASADPAMAEAALTAAKDSSVGLFTSHSPRILTAVQEEMRRKVTEHGFVQVDLAREIRLATDGAPPDRRFFLDYCHLSFDGLALAAAITASRLAPLLGGKDVPAETLVSGLREPHPTAAAVAHFLAAMHNAHYGQPPAILRHHLERALDHDPDVAERMRDYLEYQSRSAPYWMCAGYTRSAAVPELARYLQVDDARLDLTLASHRFREIILDLIGGSDEYEGLLVEERAAPEVDLLADRERATTFRERLGSGAGRRRAFLVAPDLESEFHLVLAEATEVELTITWRLPAGDPDIGSANIHVNGRPTGSAPVRTEWTTMTTRVSADHWRRGHNTITIGWPFRSLPGDERVKEAADSLEGGALPDSYPGHGHVFAFTATRATAAAHG